MGMTHLQRLIPFACLLALALSALGCGGTAGRTNTPAALGGASDTAAAPELIGAPDMGNAGATQVTEVTVPDAAEIAALPAPDGVDADIWTLLTTELSRVLAEYQGLPDYRDLPDYRGRSGDADSRNGSGGVPAAGFIPGQPGTKAASAPPTGAAGVVEISYYEPSSTLRWLYANSGDYDQNGLVGVSDLTPLGVHFGEESPGGAGTPFPPESLGSAIDGNADGLIGVGDITPIGQYFGTQVAGYNVYTSADPEDYPLDPADPNGPGASLSGFVDLTGAIGGVSERKQLEYVLPEEAVPGVYWVRPTDGEGDGAASNAVVIGTSNLAPIAVINAEPTKGLETLTVEFSGLASGDLDGQITKYEWDWNGPVDGEEWEDTGLSGVVTHIYDAVGDYLAILRVTDDGGKTDTDEIMIKVKTPVPPVASLTADPPAGATPLAVDFSSNVSGDLDGQIVNWEWDFDQSGEFAFDTGSSPVTRFYYYEPGTYSTSVRVTDDDGLSSTTSIEVVVEKGAFWHDPAYPEANTSMQNFTALAEVAGVPAIAYDARTFDPTQYWVKYVRAQDVHGTSWADPIAIHETFNTSDIALAEVAGFPATTAAGSGAFRYTRAEDSEGSLWPASVYSYQPYWNVITFVVVEGLPALCGGAQFVRALDLAGDSWSDAASYAHGYIDASDAHPSLSLVNGRPAISYLWHASGDGNGQLMYVWAGDAEGQAWGASTTIDAQGDTGYDSRLLEADGNPSIAYYDSKMGVLRYVRALDATGSAWGASRILGLGSRPKAMILVENRPAILYHKSDDSLHCIVANDPAGASWGFPMMIASDVMGSSPSLALINGQPAVGYLSPPEGPFHSLSFAAYY